ncbi:hypothetical protein SODG_003456 [Sodalis praecaptivus]
MLMLFATVALVHLIALMSPGPDFFFVSQTAASRSRRQAMYGVMGITLGVAIWAAVALLGLHLLLSRMAWLHNLITFGGGLYLCWMGWQLLRAAARRQAPAGAHPPAVAADGGREHRFYAACSLIWPTPRRLSISAAYFCSSSAIISAPAPALGYSP